MNRRRDALRRGIRSLIQDTSRELSTLTGLEPAAIEDGNGTAPPDPHTERLSAGAAATLERPAETPPNAVPPLALTPARTPPPAQLHEELPPASPAPPRARVTGRAEVAGRPSPRRQSASRKPAKRKAARVKATPGSARRAGRLPRAHREEVPLDGIGPQAAHARKGVCSAYFINKQCWRVPKAYCNTALQVCVLRECPVYHLHKEALERRFAEKYKHFW